MPSSPPRYLTASIIMAFQAFTGLATAPPMNAHLPIAHRPADPITEPRSTAYMATLDERFQSFHNWPLEIKPFPAVMALAGFYHSNHNTDAVTCFCCQLIVKDWKKKDDPIQRHRDQLSIPRPCAWISKVGDRPAQYTSTPPATPPVPASASIPHKCKVCRKTFPSGSSFHKHRRQSHKNAGGRIGVPLNRPGVVFLGRYRVSKASRQRKKHSRRGRTDLFSQD